MNERVKGVMNVIPSLTMEPELKGCQIKYRKPRKI